MENRREKGINIKRRVVGCKTITAVINGQTADDGVWTTLKALFGGANEFGLNA
jgi:hypothetical protein